MSKKNQYIKNKPQLLNDLSICKANRDLFEKFLNEKEYKLKRINGIPKLTETQYKTLSKDISQLKNINLFFKNKPLTEITKADIKRVYDALEDQKLKGLRGGIIIAKEDYYNKFFKSLLFEIAGKDKLAKEVIKYYNNNHQDAEVRFFEEETHKKIVDVVTNPIQKCLCWLAWDIGENIFTLLELQKKDFVRQINPNSKESEYIVNLPREKIKSSRTARSEITNYKETVDLLDIVLKDLQPDDKLFKFGHRQALKFLHRAVKIINAKCIPKGQSVTWKDYRSSMACNLLRKGWTTDEIKSRLGHKPSSRVLNKYVSYHAIGKHRTKKKLYDNDLFNVKNELEEAKQREKLQSSRIERQKEDLERQQMKILKLERAINNIKKFDSLATDLFMNKNVQETVIKAMLKRGLGKKLMELLNNQSIKV
jgi:hypothetical protein